MPAAPSITKTRPRFFARHEAWDRLRRTRNLESPGALAIALGVSEPTVWRVLTNKSQRPGEEFLAASMLTFPDDFKDLFSAKRVTP